MHRETNKGGRMMIEEKVKEMLKEKTWTFEDIQNMQRIVNMFVENIQKEMSWEDKVKRILTDIPFSNTDERGEPVYMTVGSYLEYMLQASLLTEVAEIMKIELMNANINFNGGDTNEIPKGSLGGESPEKGKTTGKKDSDE